MPRTRKGLFKQVGALDAPYIGHVVSETPNVIVVFGKGDDRYDILKSEILRSKNDIRVGLPLYEIARRYKRSREAALPISRTSDPPEGSRQAYSNLLVGKKVKSRDGDFIGHAIAEFHKTFVVFGHHHYRFDIPKSKIKRAGNDIILGLRYEEAFHYSRLKEASPRTRNAAWRLANGIA